MNSLAVTEAPAEEAEPKFSAFTGIGRRLDGKSSNHQPQPISSARSFDEKQSGASSRYGHSQQSAGSSTSVNGTRQSQGKLVFGQNANRNPKEAPKVPILHLPLSYLNHCFVHLFYFQKISLVKGGFFCPLHPSKYKYEEK